MSKDLSKTEYRVVGRNQTALFGPTGRLDIAERVCDSRVERYPFLGPWRIESRSISGWQNVTGTLFQ